MIAIRILFGAIVVYGVCRAAGYLLFSALKLSFRRAETSFLEFMAGTPLVSLLVFSLASARLVYTSVLCSMGALILLAAVVTYKYRRRQTPSAQPDSEPLPVAWQLAFWIPFLVFSGLYVIAAMSPETSPDGTGYHLGLISRYYDHRGFYRITTNQFAGLAEGIEMLFLMAFAIGRHSAAAMVHLLFLLTLPFGMMAWARRFGFAKAGVLAALLFYLAPIVGKDGTIAYVDVATAAVVFAVFFLLEVWRQDHIDRILIPAGLLAGFAYACKITAATTVVHAFLYVVVVCLLRRCPIRVVVRSAGTVALFASIVAVPWMLKDLIQFGNPFFPLFNNWFPNPYQYPMVEAEMRQIMTNVSGVSLSRIPYQVIMGGSLFGVLGPVFALSPLAFLALRTAAGRRLALAFLPVFITYFTNINARFLIPSLPFLALAFAIGLLSLPRIGPALALTAILLHAFLSWPMNIRLWSDSFQWKIDQTDWRIALRRIPEQQYLETFWPDYKPGLLLDRFVPAGERVFSPDLGQMAYQRREVIGTWDSAFGRRAFLTFLMAEVPELGSTWHREIHFRHVTTSRIRLVADSDIDTDVRISELRFALDAAEILRGPKWRISASANPWEVQYAFDGSAASWWTSGQRPNKGIWLQTDFAQPVTLNRVLVDQSEDQRWISLKPEAWLDGRWVPLHARESDLETPPRATLRREVRDELKFLNIHWILMRNGSFGAEDLRNNAGLWGISQVAEANGFKLWRLN